MQVLAGFAQRTKIEIICKILRIEAVSQWVEVKYTRRANKTENYKISDIYGAIQGGNSEGIR